MKQTWEQKKKEIDRRQALIDLRDDGGYVRRKPVQPGNTAGAGSVRSALERKDPAPQTEPTFSEGERTDRAGVIVVNPGSFKTLRESAYMHTPEYQARLKATEARKQREAQRQADAEREKAEAEAKRIRSQQWWAEDTLRKYKAARISGEAGIVTGMLIADYAKYTSRIVTQENLQAIVAEMNEKAGIIISKTQPTPSCPVCGCKQPELYGCICAQKDGDA